MSMTVASYFLARRVRRKKTQGWTACLQGHLTSVSNPSWAISRIKAPVPRRTTTRRETARSVPLLGIADSAPERRTPRKLIVPYAGTGSEMIGAVLAGWDEVLGIEREQEYVEIAGQRIAHWTRKGRPNDAPQVQIQHLPDLMPTEFEAMKASIAERGVDIPIIVDDEGNIIDGWRPSG